MASDKPLPDRCGARVQDRMGLEVYDEERDETFSTEDRLEAVVFVKDETSEVMEDPDYQDTFDYTNKGFVIGEVHVESDDGEREIIELQDDDPDTSHTHMELQGYCERFPMDNGRCYVHGGGAGPPEGNTNRLTHGLRAKRSNYYDQLDDEEQSFIEEMAHSWIENGPFDQDNFAKVNEVYRIAVDQHRLWNAHDEVVDGLVTEQTLTDEGDPVLDSDGDPVEVKDESPVNLAYDRLDRTTTRKLKELGCLDDPDSQQAEATESLADKFEKLSE